MKRKRKLTRLMKAENAFRIAYQEHTAWGQKMVNARTELLEANAEERAKLAVKYTDDQLIQSAAKQATDEMLAWYKRIGLIDTIEKHCENCNKLLNEVETKNTDVTMCIDCEDSAAESRRASQEDF